MNEAALNPEAKGKVVGEGHAAISCQNTRAWRLPITSTSFTSTTINSGRTLLRKSWPDPGPEVRWVFWMLVFKGVWVSLQTFAAASPPVKLYTSCAPQSCSLSVCFTPDTGFLEPKLHSPHHHVRLNCLSSALSLATAASKNNTLFTIKVWVMQQNICHSETTNIIGHLSAILRNGYGHHLSYGFQ